MSEMQIEFPGGARVDAHYKGFLIRSDQPSHAGGTGSAPAPFDLFLASIGTCAGFYVYSFLAQRGLSADGVHLTLSTVKDPATHMVSEIVVRIELPDSFPRKYDKAIARAVDLCSVKKHILDAPAFRTVVEIGVGAPLETPS